MVSLLLGLVALTMLILSWFPSLGLGFFPFIAFILAIVASATGKKMFRVDPSDKNARAGKTIGTIVIVLSVLSVIWLLIKIIFLPAAALFTVFGGWLG